jgi:hypothetical protein
MLDRRATPVPVGRSREGAKTYAFQDGKYTQGVVVTRVDLDSIQN